LPKYYANACIDQPASYSDYPHHQLVFRPFHGYEKGRKLGSGEFADVFEGKKLATGERIVLKTLKPIKISRIKREIKILQDLQGGPNILQLIDIVRDPVTNVSALITEYVEGGDINYRGLYSNFTNSDAQYYMYELFKALDYCHSRGIMHRDVKPQNVVIDHAGKKLRLLDFGISEYYFPGKEYGVRVASRNYKGPELLVNLTTYDYSLDIWSAGCLFAAMLFKRGVIFKGNDNYDQLVKIAEILGTDDLVKYIDKYNLVLDVEYTSILGLYKQRPWSSFVTKFTQPVATKPALDLLSLMLKYDHAERITARDAMKHPYFNNLRKFHEENQ